MERLGIDEIIEHCKRKTEKYEQLNGIKTLENADLSDTFVKQYWEHRQVAEYLEELKKLKDLEKQGKLLKNPQELKNDILNRMKEFMDKYESHSKSAIDYFGAKADSMQTAMQIVKLAFSDSIEEEGTHEKEKEQSGIE